jgi:hypothetical protein
MGKVRRIPYNKSVWMTAEAWFDGVAEAREKNTDFRQKLFGNTYLSSSIFQGNCLRYTGIHDFREDGKVVGYTGINMNDSEWDVLVNNFTDIKKMLKDQSRANLKREFNEYPSVWNISVFKFEWFVNGKPVEDNPSLEYFSEAEARSEAVMHEPLCDIEDDTLDVNWVPNEYKIKSFSKLPPHAAKHMKLIYMNRLMCEINDIVKGKCEACKARLPGQKQHRMLGGCLDLNADHVTEYFCEAKGRITVLSLTQVYDRSRFEIGARADHASWDLALGAIEFIPDSEMIRKLSSKTFIVCDDDDDYLEPLNKIIRKFVIKDMYTEM